MNKIYADIIADYDKTQSMDTQLLYEGKIVGLPNIDNSKIGSFDLNEVQRLLVTEALFTAKKMRQEGEGNVEDVARAIILIKGGGYLRAMDDPLEGKNEEDSDRQMIAYMDGAGELMRRFPAALRQLKNIA